MSLVEQAKNTHIKSGRPPRTYLKDEIDLVLAWVEDEVTLTQVTKVMKLNNNTATYIFLALALKQFMLEHKGK